MCVAFPRPITPCTFRLSLINLCRISLFCRCSRNSRSATLTVPGVVENIRSKLALGGRTGSCSGSQASLAISSSRRCAPTRFSPLAATATTRTAGKTAFQSWQWHHRLYSDPRCSRLPCNCWSCSLAWSNPFISILVYLLSATSTTVLMVYYNFE